MYSKYEKRACSRCSKWHICTGSPICPCFEILVPDKVLDYIASHFDECACIDCMVELKNNDHES